MRAVRAQPSSCRLRSRYGEGDDGAASFGHGVRAKLPGDAAPARDARAACVTGALRCRRGFGGQSHSTGYDGGNRAGKRLSGAVVDWRHSTNSRHFACFFFFSRFDKP
ncbi:hypothetical protein DPV79_22135 [Burkholderia reimsis]|uniref:Uncharacterized protein n=1 Tax=Burkholderia reimsis TaxID=2234132 RepID=A0A365QRW1_9BURK|nr:hypothetical protein DPV79_22135 [Burkholderia reimsis]